MIAQLIKGGDMKKRAFFSFFIILILIGMSNTALSTTWCRREFTCPICQTKNSFNTPMSSGSYIYDWPSKYQYVFWPLTTLFAVYTCENCRLSCFMWDFEDIPDEKFNVIRDLLKKVRIEKVYEDYADIPITKRLEIAEKVYSVMDKGDDFWCRFYRVMGYHYENEKEMEKANAARRKALEFAKKILGSHDYAEKRKEFLLISGAIHHLLGEEELALVDMKEALKLTYKDSKMRKEDEIFKDEYLSKLLTEYIEIVERWHKIRALKKAAAGAHSQEEKERIIDKLHREGLGLYHEEKYKEAIEVWLLEIEVAPEKMKAYNNIGIAYRKLKDLDAAVKYHHDAMRVNPNFGHTYYSLGLVHYDREDYEKVIELLQKAIELNYANVDVYFTLGQAFSLMEDYDRAIEAYKKADELYYKYPGLHYRLGEAYRLQGKYDEAVFELKKEISLNPKWKKWCRMSLLEIETALDPTKIESFFILGKMYRKVESKEYFEKSIQAFKRVVDLDSSYPEVHYQLGQAYEEMEDFPAAEQEYRKEIEVHPDNIDAREALGKLKKTFPKYNYSETEEIELTEKDDFKRMIQLQDHWKRISFESLNLFKDADPRMAELIEFMKKNAYYPLPVGPVATRTVLTIEQLEAVKANPYSFEIVYMPVKYAQDMPSSVLTESSGRTVRIAAEFKIKEWLGIMLAHELFHVHSILVKGEDPSDSEQYLEGEVEAHLLEMKLLKSWNEEAYDILIAKGIPLYQRNDEDGLSRLFNTLYPLHTYRFTSDNRAVALGSASCLAAVAFEDALKKGIKKEELGKVFKKLRENS